jgi:hypothetical protein
MEEGGWDGMEEGGWDGGGRMRWRREVVSSAELGVWLECLR